MIYYTLYIIDTIRICYYIMLYYIILYYVMLCYVVFYYVMLYYIILHYIILYYITLYTFGEANLSDISQIQDIPAGGFDNLWHPDEHQHSW